LGGKEIREIAMFLRKFKGSQIVIDGPHGMPKEIFY
jgi:hypothetical protein